MYESRISDARWIAYDTPGNICWITFLAGVILCFVFGGLLLREYKKREQAEP